MKGIFVGSVKHFATTNVGKNEDPGLFRLGSRLDNDHRLADQREFLLGLRGGHPLGDRLHVSVQCRGLG